MAAAGTFVRYGNVQINRCVERDFRCDPVYDESNTDLLYYKYTVRVSGYLHGHTDWSYFHSLPYVNDGTGATGAHKLIRYQLPPRQPFLMAVGAQEDGIPAVNGVNQPIVLLEANPAPLNMIPPGSSSSGNINLHNLDLCNGPKCLEFAVTHITGNELFAVDATFEVCKLECAPNGACPNNTYGILSNRWSVVDSLDSAMRTTRVYHGTLVLASANLNGHMLRGLCAPPLQPLFRRDRMEFVLSEDGLRLRWSVTDVEIAASAPYPARKWNVTHTERANGAKMGMSSIQVDLEGDSNVNKADLVELAIHIISMKLFDKLPMAINPADASYLVHSIEFTDIIGDRNAISASAQVSKPLDAVYGLQNAMHKFGRPIAAADLPAPNNGAAGGLGGAPILDAGGNVIGYQGDSGGNLKYDRAISWGGYAGQIPKTEGPAQIIGIFAAFLQSPCDNQHAVVRSGYGLPTSNNSTLSPVDQNPRVPYTASVVPDIYVQPNPIYSTSHITAPYMRWQIDNIYKRRSMRVQMPIASSSPSPYAATSAFPKLANDQCIRILRVEAERLGADPEFFDPENIPPWPYPDPVPTGYVPITQYYLSHKIRPGQSIETATGQKLHRATMEIRIGLSRPPTPAEKLALGNDLWTNGGQLTTSTTLTNSSW